VNDPNDRTRLQVLDAFVDARWSVHRRFTRAARFAVHAPPGATVRVQCTGLGCRKRLAGARLQPGARIVVRVTSVGRIGRYFEYRIRAGKQPRFVALCLPLSGSAPGPC
jgi:hypothetical protein